MSSFVFFFKQKTAYDGEGRTTFVLTTLVRQMRLAGPACTGRTTVTECCIRIVMFGAIAPTACRVTGSGLPNRPTGLHGPGETRKPVSRDRPVGGTRR